MKKLIIAAALSVLAGVAAMAQTAAAAQTQATPWTWQLQTGYATSTKSMDSGWTGATSIGYQFTGAFKLNFDLGYFQGKIKETNLQNHIWTFMVAPTYVYNASPNDQVYGFVGAGLADRGSKTYTDRASSEIRLASESKFAAEAGIGYNHFFNKNVGINLQATYTYMDFETSLEPVDGRVGLIVRW